MLTLQLITTFYYVVSEQTGNDLTVARAKTMIALASLTWPSLHLAVTPVPITPERLTWKSAGFDKINEGASFRRDPIGDDAPIVMDNVEASELIEIDKMRECATIIPLFGRQRLERFNITLAELFAHQASATPLPLPGSAPSRDFHCEIEYQKLHEWLVGHGIISPDGEWLADGGKGAGPP
jgi:hypothetical protein